MCVVLEAHATPGYDRLSCSTPHLGCRDRGDLLPENYGCELGSGRVSEWTGSQRSDLAVRKDRDFQD